jgi:hypothetical protein
LSRSKRLGGPLTRPGPSFRKFRCERIPGILRPWYCTTPFFPTPTDRGGQNRRAPLSLSTRFSRVPRRLSEMANCYCHPGKAGGTPRTLGSRLPSSRLSESLNCATGMMVDSLNRIQGRHFRPLRRSVAVDAGTPMDPVGNARRCPQVARIAAASRRAPPMPWSETFIGPFQRALPRLYNSEQDETEST